MFSIFSKKKTVPKKASVFFHIPKSGGSTFVGLLQASLNQNAQTATPTHKTDSVGNTTIFHIDFLDKHRRFKGAKFLKDIEINNRDDKEMFLILRNPLDRLISEFNFQFHILDGKNGNTNAAIITKLKQKPKTFEAYIACKETQNYQSKFLLGRPINDPKKITDKEFERLIDSIESLPIHCGITDEYASFLNLFEEKTGIVLPKKVTVRKKTPFMYQTIVDETIKSRVMELNAFDYKLYEYAKNKVVINNKKFKFIQSDQFIV
ncbi:sulfotransferase family 2 domain-containing protein [uncultured Psychroserpens sp.]|uniref:sulfotransferase family 2 domain-containing protein n=1 Tax=uncultured Psychroserpens sp. TaxID=255436 RepID=UPI0026258A31|nr:sulfotransferase family 2 domain-containing protein [uncultured Psychroserpens sp.]